MVLKFVIIISFCIASFQTLIGSGCKGFTDGSFSSCSLNNPQGIAFHHPNIYIADTGNHAIRCANLLTRSLKTIAGNGCQGKDLEGGKIGIEQEISSPWDVCLVHSISAQSQGNTKTDEGNNLRDEDVLLIAMAGTHQIWGLFLTQSHWWKGSFYSAGSVVRLVGSGEECNRNTTYPLRAGFAQPSGLAVLRRHGKSEEVFIADAESSSVRKLNLCDGAVKAVVGGGRDPTDLFSFGDVDGVGVDAKLQHPLSVDSFGDVIFVADTFNHKIKRIESFGKSFRITTINSLQNDEFNEPSGLCVSEDGNQLWIADTNNHCIKLFCLKNHTIKQLQIEFIDTVDSPHSCNATTVCHVLPNVSNHLILHLQLQLPDGAYLNVDAPNVWLIENELNILVQEKTGNFENGNAEVGLTILFKNVEGINLNENNEASLTIDKASMTTDKASLTTEEALLTTYESALTTDEASLTTYEVSLAIDEASMTTDEASLTIDAVIYICMEGVCIMKSIHHSLHFVSSSEASSIEKFVVNLAIK